MKLNALPPTWQFGLISLAWLAAGGIAWLVVASI
jgi:hypothetical protein